MVFSSTWEAFNNEIIRIQQGLTNNNFPITFIKKVIEQATEGAMRPKEQAAETINLFYRNQFTANYKNDEEEIKAVLRRNVKPKDISHKLVLSVYYKNRKLKQLLIGNKLHGKTEDARVVYQYTCEEDTCNGVSYIGYTTCSLRKRFYMHVQSGSIKSHLTEVHRVKPTSAKLIENTKVIFRAQPKQELVLAEALLIGEMKPCLNRQDEGLNRVLEIF